MRKRRLCTWLLLIIFFQKLAAQPAEGRSFFRPLGFSFSLAGGYGISTKPQKVPSLALPELPFPTTGVTWSFFDVNYTFPNHWGIRLLGDVVRARPAWEKPVKILEETFPGYFIGYSSTSYIHLSSDQLFIGLTYTRSRSRLFLQPTLMIGFSEINYRQAVVKAKEAGTNRLYSLDFSPVKDTKWAYSTTLLTGAKLGYFFSKRWSIYTSIDGTAIRHNLQYAHRKTEEIAKITTTEIRSFRAWQYAVSAQFGVSFFLKHKRKY